MGENRPTGWPIVMLMCVGIFVCMIDTTIMNIALPVIQEKLGTSLEMSSWMLNVYTMSIAVLSIPLARIAEIFGKGKFFVLGLLAFALGSALCGLANGGEWLIGSRFVQSIGAAILMPLSMIIGVGAVPLEKRRAALGVLGSMQGLSAAMGPTVGGLITQTFGWEWVFYVNVPICLVAAVFALRMLKVRNEARVWVKIDVWGVLLSSVAIFALTLVLIQGNHWGWTSGRAWACYAGAVAALGVFLLVESKVSQPMVNLKLFKNRTFVSATMALLVSTAFMVGMTVLLPQFLTRFQGKTEIGAALLVTPISLAIFLIAPFAGLFASKFGTRLTAFSGFLLIGFAYFRLRGLSVDTSAFSVIATSATMGLGYGLIVGPGTMASAANFEGEMLTASQSVTQMFRQIAIVLGVAVFIAGLSHNLTVQKEKVLTNAAVQAQALDVPQEVRDTVLAKTREGLAANGNGGKVATEEKGTQPVVSAEQREKLIQDNVQKSLAKVPAAQQEQARPQVTAQVTQAVDEQIKKVSEQVEGYRTTVTAETKQTMGDAFSTLYKYGWPVVTAFALLAFLFPGRVRRGEAGTPVAPTTQR
jgi:EmrB/QacA subfamily drug resistance transporter